MWCSVQVCNIIIIMQSIIQGLQLLLKIKAQGKEENFKENIFCWGAKVIYKFPPLRRMDRLGREVLYH